MTDQAVVEVEELACILIESERQFDELLADARIQHIFKKELAREIDSPSNVIPSYEWDY